MNLTKVQRGELRMRFGGKCAYCGCELSDRWCADHVEPIYRRSKWMDTATGYKLVQTGECDMPHRDTLDNLFPCCQPCNIYKGPLSLTSWRRTLEDVTGILYRGYPTYRHAVRFAQVIEQPGPIIFWFEKWEAEKQSPA
jgi:hypothetical protein